MFGDALFVRAASSAGRATKPSEDLEHGGLRVEVRAGKPVGQPLQSGWPAGRPRPRKVGLATVFAWLGAGRSRVGRGQRRDGQRNTRRPESGQSGAAAAGWPWASRSCRQKVRRGEGRNLSSDSHLGDGSVIGAWFEGLEAIP